MQPQTNPTTPPETPVEGLLRTRYTLVVCVACGHEHIHTPRQQSPSCPECRGSARRSFALFRDLREEHQ